MNTKMIAMYLPQYHETPENNKWWGEGFTDWVSVKQSSSLFKDHNQPRVPLNNNYYDLSNVENIRWQAEIAQKYGIYGFAFYHYWFSSEQRTLTRPAELLLEHKDIAMPFCFAWDNVSWIRTWSKFKKKSNAWSPKIDEQKEESDNSDNGVLAKFDYGEQKDWKIHFDYLLPFFKDERYIKIDNKPVFIIWTYNQKPILTQMCAYWRVLAKENGFDDMYFIGRVVPYDRVKCFDRQFNYEPQFSGWLNKNLFNRIWNKLLDNHGRTELVQYDYDIVWKRIIRFAKQHRKVMYGGFVDYDDTPRRGNKGKVVCGATPEKFKTYLKQLFEISCKTKKEFLFLTAWNEWGESAYLEPDTLNGFQYLQAVKEVIENHK